MYLIYHVYYECPPRFGKFVGDLTRKVYREFPRLTSSFGMHRDFSYRIHSDTNSTNIWRKKLSPVTSEKGGFTFA